MTEVLNPFNREHDYLEDLNRDEVLEKEGRKFPRLRGLQRLAHNNRGGVRCAGPVGQPQFVTGQKNRLAIATVRYQFFDGTEFSGTADASTLAHKPPYSDHLVALAESKAEARALRRAFNISACAAEEIGNAPIAGRDDGEIEDTQVSGIKMVGKRKGLNEQEILDLIKNDAGSLKELTAAEGRDAMKAINKLKGKKTK